jgi:hypothetical protein
MSKSRHQATRLSAEIEEETENNDLIVYTASARAFRRITNPELVVKLRSLLEADNGTLAQYHLSYQNYSTKENSQVFANGITALTEVVQQIGVYPSSPGNYEPITGLVANPVEKVYDPALVAFFILNIMIAQYLRLVNNCPNKLVALVFAKAFEQISHHLLITYPNITTPIVDLTYVSAVAHYTNVQLRIEPSLPIVNYNPEPI